MVNMNLWLSDKDTIKAVSRAASAWKRINDKPSSVAFKDTTGTVLAAQTVRIEYDNSVSQSEAASGRTAVRKVNIFGVWGHDSITDTDMKEGYRFILNNDQYRIVDIILTIGEIQAIAEAVG